MSDSEDPEKNSPDLETRKRIEEETYVKNLESLVKARTHQLQESMQNLERSYDSTLDALGNALEMKESSVVGHAKRVTLFTIALAQAMGMSRDKIAVIARGAFLHDIGKMGVSETILRNNGPLSPEDTEKMREHCLLGHQLLRKIPYLSGEPADIVYAHHENFDGSGYPRGLKGDQISLGARIVAIANTLDSITSDLPYRPGRSVSWAREEIQRGSGRQFDPEVVSVFLELPDNMWADLRREAEAEKT